MIFVSSTCNEGGIWGNFLIFLSPDEPSKELIHKRIRRMIPPFRISRTDILLSPTLNANNLSKSKVVCNRPKLFRAARLNASTAINQAKLDF